jgi:mono/diheme cytochrome c family protein
MFGTIAAVAVLCVAVLSGCGGHMDRCPMCPVPQAIEGSLSDMTVAEFYAANCAACHGSERTGGVGPSLLPAALTQPDDFYFETIRDGRPGTVMPAWGDLGMRADEIRALVSFLRTQR